MAAIIDRRRFTLGAGSVSLAMPTILGSGAGTGARAAAPEITSIRTSAKSWLYTPEDVAIERGMFRDAGVSVKAIATNRGTNHDALLGGASDIILGAATQNMRVQIRNQPVKMIGGFVNKYASNIVIRKDIAERIQVSEASPVEAKGRALKGLRVGTTGPGGGPDQLVRYVMSKGGLTPDQDAELVPVQGGGQAMLAALKAQRIDGFCLSSPTSDVACARFGATYLFNMATNPPAELSDYLYISVSALDRTIQEKAEPLKNYLRGIAAALRYMDTERDSFRAWAKTWFAGMDDDLFDVSFQNNVGIYMKSPVPNEAEFAIAKTFLANELKTMNQQPMPPSLAFKDVFDTSLVEAALRDPIPAR